MVVQRSFRSDTNVDRQPVAIVSVDPLARTATALTRIKTTVNVNCSFATGDSIVVPAVGEQWYIERYEREWRLYGRVPFNDPTLLIEPKEGQVSVGSASGPLELNGPVINAHGPIALTPFDTADLPAADDTAPGTVAYDSALKQPVFFNGTDWGAMGEPAIDSGTTSQYWRGDKTWATLDKAAVGLDQVDNTSDADKPVSDATRAAIESIDLSGITTALAGKTDKSTLSAKGDMYVASGAATVDRLAVGSSGQALVADSGEFLGVKWAAPTVDSSNVTGAPLSSSLIPGLDASKIVSGLLGSELIPGLNADKITSGLLDGTLIPNLPATIINSGTFLPGLIPGLDSSKIISGVLNTEIIPGLNADKIIAGTLALDIIPGLSADKIISGVLDGSLIPNLPADIITSGQLLVAQIPNLPASIINSGTLLLSTIPNLPADIISTGTFLVSRIPGLDSSKIISGILNTELIPGLNADKIIAGTLGTSLIPGLNADKIISGVLNGSLIPNLPASIINSGTFLATQIPGLDVSKIISGVFGTGLIPSLDVSKITTGVFGPGFIPSLDASKIISGVFPTGLIPNLPISQIATLPSQLATMFSPFNPPQTIGPGQITVEPQNLLKNWNFPDASSLAGETVWAWDSATQAAPGGSAKVNAAVNTNTKALQADPIQVVAGDTINASAFTQWSGLTYTGTPIALMLNLYDASNALLSQIPLATAAMTGATSSWVQLAGSYTIPDASTAVWARLVYNVSTAATAGSVWFTNGSLIKPNPIPQAAVQNLTGILGGVDVGSTFQDFVDAGVQGIVNDFGTLTGQSLASFNQQISNMARFLGFVTSGAAPQNSVAQIASAVDNTVKARAVQKAFNENIDPTTDAVFPLSQVWQNATLPTVAATAGATVMGDITIRDGGDKNAVTWYGYPAGGNFGSITDFRVNVYSINKATNVRTRVHGSINLIGSATPPGTGSAPVFNSYNLPAAISNVPGDRLTAEIAILGSGTYNVVGQTISGQIPFHSVYGLHGLTRASAAAPTTANPPGVGGSPLSYSRAIPWIGMSGVQSATQFTPVTIPYYSSGSFDPSIYQWANYMDAIVCGPGGRGADGAGYWGGNAGSPGSWNSADGIPKSVWGAVTTTVNITNGASQAASGITIPGWGTLVGPAGANNANVSATSNLGYPGAGPGDRYDNGQRYPGGNGGATAQASGGQPGGAGAGGNAPFTVGTNIYGGNGGPGIAYLRLYQ